MLCTNCQAALIPQAKLATRLRKVNKALHSIGLRYWDTLGSALDEIDRALEDNGFISGTVYGAPIPIHEPVGHDKWLTVSIHRVESGRYEVTAYVN